MNRGLVDNINSVVGETDHLYILGDLAFQPKKRLSDIVDLLKSIHCYPNIHVCLGNHDTVAGLVSFGVDPKNIFDSKIISINKIEFVLSHYPYVDFCSGRDKETRMFLPFGTIQNNPATGKPYNRLSGHVHELWALKPHNLNVGVDVHNFMPLSENQIIEIYNDSLEFRANFEKYNAGFGVEYPEKDELEIK